MLYAQFFQKAVYPAGTDKIIPACGDRSVIILDGRKAERFQRMISADECRKRGYVGYQLWKGESFTRSNPVSEIVEVK